MRLLALIGLAACTGDAGGPTPIPSARGPAMVAIPASTVRLGARQTGPVDGFVFRPGMVPGAAGSGTGGAGGPGGEGGPGGPGGPVGPPPAPGQSVPPPPGTPPSAAPSPTGASPNSAPPNGASPNSAPPNGASPTGASPTGPPRPALPGGGPSAPLPLPDRGIAPGAHTVVDHPVPDPLTPRLVEVSAFYIDITEVTRAQYAAFLDDTGYRPPSVEEPWADDGWSWTGTTPPPGTADHPVVLTSWYDARAFCTWADKRLPTEAEWQLAALGPADDEWLFPWGDVYDPAKLNHGTFELPNYDDSDGYERTSPVGSFPAGASRYGLLDTFGNAWEWTADMRVASWDDVRGERRNGPDGERIVDPHTDPDGLYAAVRGGAFFFDFRPNPAGERSGFIPELRRKSTGFRCARDG